MLRIKSIVGKEGSYLPKGIWPLGFPEKATPNCRQVALVNEWIIGGTVDTQIKSPSPRGAVPIAATASSQKVPRAQSELLGAQCRDLLSLSVLHKWMWFPKLCNRVAVSSWNQNRDQNVGPRGRTVVHPPFLSSDIMTVAPSEETEGWHS